MKSLFKLNYLNIKNNKYIIISILIVIYGFILPLVLSNQSVEDDKIIIWFQYLQKLLIIPMIIMSVYLYKPYVEIEYQEVIRSLNQRNQYIYLFHDICLVQFFMIPFYGCLIFINDHIFPYVLIVMIQFIVLMSVYQVISLITHSTTLSLGLIFCYILLFSLVFNDVTIGNLFVNEPIQYIQINYFGICFVVILGCYGISRFIQKYQ